MDRSLRLRSFILVGIIALCVAYLLPTFVSGDSLPTWYPFNSKIKLGLDLQGGVRAVYRIDLDKAVDDKASEVKRDLEAKLAEKQLGATVTTPGGVRGAVTVTVTDPAKKAEIDQLVFSEHAGEVQRRDCPGKAAETANQICMRISSKFADEVRKSALAQAVATVKKRVNEKGVAEPNVMRQDQKIIVELPGIGGEVRDEVKELIARTAKLEFKVVDNANPYMQKLYSRIGRGDIAADPKAAALGITAVADSWTNEKSGEVFQDWYLKAKDREEQTPVADAKKTGCWRKELIERNGNVACNVNGRKLIERYLADLASEGDEWKVPDDNSMGFEKEFPQSGGKDGGDTDPYWRTYLLERAVRLTGTSISKASVTYDQNTLRPEVIIRFNRYGGRMFGNMTGENVGKKMAIILDDEVRSAPIIQTKIAGGVSTITMGGADADSMEKEANDLVNVLRTGALPAPLQEESLADLGPTLGRDAVSKAQLSFALGTILVIGMMVGIYRWSGLVAVTGIMINLLMQLTVMAAFKATLTLPGIAALVLTVGMDGDGNLLIDARIRDELNLGKSVRGAVDIGFARAFSTILDGHMTTAAAGWVLLQYGTGPIHGFAVLLLVGIGTTLFVNTWVTRLLFDWYISRKKGELATISI
jgi:preprotein translocase subunit SecD